MIRLKASDVVIYGSQLIIVFAVERLLRPHVSYDPARLLVTFLIVALGAVFFLSIYRYRISK